MLCYSYWRTGVLPLHPAFPSNACCDIATCTDAIAWCLSCDWGCACDVCTKPCWSYWQYCRPCCPCLYCTMVIDSSSVLLGRDVATLHHMSDEGRHVAKRIMDIFSIIPQIIIFIIWACLGYTEGGTTEVVRCQTIPSKGVGVTKTAFGIGGVVPFLYTGEILEIVIYNNTLQK